MIGMDLGASGARFLRLKRDPQAAASSPPEVLDFFFFPGTLLSEPEREIPSCRDFLKAHHLQGEAVACNIEDPSIKIRRIDLPKMPDLDLREAVRWQLRDVAEGSIDSYVVRYSVLEEYSVGDVKRLSLMAYAIKKEAVARHVDLLQKLSLKPKLIEPTAVSLLAAFDRIHGWKADETYALIDIGESKALFLVLGDGKLFFSRPLTGISLKGAKLPEKSETSGPEHATFYSALAIEIQRSLDAYSLMFHKERVDHFFVTGGGARLPELIDYLTKNLGIPSEVFDPYAVALGLALYGGSK